MEISNLSDAKFKRLITKMLKELSVDLSNKKDSVRNEEYAIIKIKNNQQ